MNIIGLPDFSRPLIFARGRGYHLFHRSGVAALPYKVELPISSDGLPKLELQMIRPAMPSPFDQGYAILSAVLEPQFDLESARAYLLQQGSSERVQACDIGQGQALFRSPELFHDSDFQEELEASNKIAFNSGTAQNLLIHLSIGAGSFWRDMILAGTLLIDARIAYRIQGVAPRIDKTVQFDPHVLLAFLQNFLDTLAGVSREELIEVLADNFSTIPVNVPTELNPTERKLFIESFADHLVLRFAQSSALDQTHTLRHHLLPSDAQARATHTWDLSVPVLAERLWEISASPFDAIGNSLSEQQLSQLVQHRTLSFIDRGKAQLHVYANFLDNAQSLVSLGAHIRQAAAPPDRPVELNKTLDVVQDQGESITSLVKNTDASINYSYEGFIVTQTEQGSIDLRTQPKNSNELLLVLSPSDFAIDSFTFTLDQDWQKMLTVYVSCRYRWADKSYSSIVQLDADAPTAQILLPIDSVDIKTEVTLKSIETGETLITDFPSRTNTHIQPLAYARCGPQQIQIVGDFASGVELLAVELLPLESNPGESSPEVVHLIPGHPQKQWSWYVQSPFKSGYWYRKLDSLGSPIAGWQSAMFPFQDLVLNASQDHSTSVQMQH